MMEWIGMEWNRTCHPGERAVPVGEDKRKKTQKNNRSESKGGNREGETFFSETNESKLHCWKQKSCKSPSDFLMVIPLMKP